jgi:hypothetical protein
MPFMGTLEVGSSCRITFHNAVATPGAVAVALVWIPNVGGTTPTPDVFAIAPGARVQRTMTVPSSQMLLVDIDLPSNPGGGVTVTVEQGTKNVATGTALGDASWSFLVV